MAVPRSRGNKLKISLPPHYYEGFLEKKGPREKVSAHLQWFVLETGRFQQALDSISDFVEDC